MAATEPRAFGAVVLAALAVPGAVQAQAESDPSRGVVAFRWLHYADAQAGLARIAVDSPALQLRTPERGGWALEAGLAADSVSGASPRWHSAVSSASRMSDERRAGDVKLVRYGARERWSIGLAASDENDFRSRAVSASWRHSSDDNNRSVEVGVAFTRDRIGSSDDPDLDERRRTVEASIAGTWALSRQDLLQASLGLSHGNGFYDDPYKRPDLRPDRRRQTVLALRWNHHFETPDVALRSSLRHYRDSFGVRSWTASAEPVWQATPRIAVAPAVRLYTQRAAWFYFDPVYSYQGEPLPPGATDPPSAPLSADHRLAGFGALSLALRVSLQLGEDWSTDLRFERYEQRGSWRFDGPGSPGLAPLRARIWTWGLSRRW